MRRSLIASAILFSVALSAQAYADAGTAGGTNAAGQPHAAPQHSQRKPGTVRSSHASHSSSSTVTYDRDSKNPNIGWHTQGGMRVCTQDCDNPEIPGSGYTCRDVQVLGMAMRECDSSN